jgi:hypothetical protein
VKEAATELEAKDKRIAELEAGSCRFNCRTAKENQEAGWLAARQLDESGDQIYQSFEEYWTTEGRHEWKRRQKTTT